MTRIIPGEHSDRAYPPHGRIEKIIKPPLPPDEAERLAALRGYQILDTEAEQAFDDLTLLAARIGGTPTALISLVDADRQWFKS